MGRNAKDFSRYDVKKIALEYASSEDEVSASYFCEMYDITEGVFYSVIKRAIVESIVNDETAQLIAKKASRNSAVHGGEGGRVRSVYKHERLMHERRNFEFTNKEKIWYATRYAESPSYVDAKTFIVQHSMTRELFDRTMSSAIVDGLVSDVIAKELLGKALQHNKEEKVRPFFEGLFAERKANMEAKKEQKRQSRMKSRKRSKAEKTKQLAEAEEEMERQKHQEFIQLGIHDFGIPDEMEEQLDSLKLQMTDVEEPCQEDVLDDDGEGNEDPTTVVGGEQLSFFK